MLRNRAPMAPPLPQRPGGRSRLDRPKARAAATLGLALILATVPPAGAALDSGIQDAIAASNTQGLLVQKMTKAVTLIALGVQTVQARQELLESRSAFQAALDRLQAKPQADAPSASSYAVSPATVARLAALWRDFNTEVQRLERAHSITSDQVAPILASGAALSNAIEESERRYLEAATVSSLDRALAKLAHAAGQQNILAESMVRDFVVLAYQQEAPAAAARLADSRDRFERGLAGLLEGAPELGLLPAPTEPLRRELEAAQAAWTALKPLLAFDGPNPPSHARVAEVAERHRALLAHLQDLARLYAAL